MAFEDFNYIALRRMTVGGEVRQPGDLVPEAAKWKDVAGKIRSGLIAPVRVKEPDPVPEQPTPRRRKVTKSTGVSEDGVDVQSRPE